MLWYINVAYIFRRSTIKVRRIKKSRYTWARKYSCFWTTFNIQYYRYWCKKTIAIYDNNNSNTQSIKRIIGIAGDKIKIENNKVYLNGKLLQEDYLTQGTNTTNLYGSYTDVTVSDGCIYVLGDNRGSSLDSRWYGCISIEKVQYRVVE